ncbi:Cytochrome P450 [Lentzea xinjiangensis]|uniref:Cytochrome P450 n=1 Tax=Lentzea xinjiangensis TaxID=402600 RepID=A0A1H9NK38_9PSEU|nr:cytochrome P450 [Lentzea xinjiangensis]SER36261.1 Cytochrome P450 [Lentzea xinjiangensis]
MSDVRFRPYTAKPAQPWADLAADRNRCPVAHNPELGAVQVTSYAGVKEVLRDHGSFSSTYSNLWPLDAPLPEYKQVLGAADPPRHTRQRKLLVRAMSASKVAAMRPFSEKLADQLVDDIIAAGTRFDLINSYARRVSESHVAELLGIPDEDRESFSHMAKLMELSVEERESHGFSAELDGIIARIADLVRRRRASGGTGDDLITQLCLAEVDGDQFDENEIAALIQLLAAAGISTTQQAIGNLVVALERHPGQRDAYLADIDGLTEAVVDEGLRYDGPVMGLWRRCLASAEVQGTEVRAMDKTLVVVAAANHDPEVFADPEEFRIDREDAAQHLTFGAGIHLCVGMNLARQEVGTAVAALYRRLPGLRLVKGADEQIPGPLVRSWRVIEMEYDPPAS